ncbi:putative aminodeoxychorismate lyase [Porphyromonas crevioricanis]|uniref:Endolytic murein transglycosylase n=2 Tax=Porphyromonas crevioricanis TaxID=393921 RepID=A0A2X4PJQ9_9PORP|nr:hypothetical protein PORCAN_983 [Porphyromonas crevioricanis JCM 13913]SQH72940.1 putative aminodeoxychorismate lyase [Porphyromonas crevioricanis]
MEGATQGSVVCNKYTPYALNLNAFWITAFCKINKTANKICYLGTHAKGLIEDCAMVSICNFEAMKTKRSNKSRRYRRKRTKSKSRLLLFLIPGILLLVFLGTFSYAYRQVAFLPAVQGADTTHLFLKPGLTLSRAIDLLEQKTPLRKPRLSHAYISWRGASTKVGQGRYILLPDMSMQEICNLLLSGGETPVSLTLRGLRTQGELVSFFSSYLAMSSQELSAALSDSSLCDSLGGFDTETIRCLFLPGDYSFPWNVSVEELLASMQLRYREYWTDKRRAQADSLRLSPIEVSIIASIVEEESAKRDEHGRIARLYLNRYRRGMRLQADPTVKFAAGRFDLRRITLPYLGVRSPYNTYQVEGLPPGPIRLARPSTMDSLLYSKPSNDLYMCAKEDFSGYHNFASTYAEHLSNARRYQAELNKRGIK